MLAAAHHSDAYADTVRADYLALPDGVETGVYALAGQVTQDAQTDFDRAAALCAYLRSAYPYTLAQNVPPAGRDFVSWFLLDERQGYCTSFATAMAVMARMVGLPARYIEGYAAVPTATAWRASRSSRRTHGWKSISPDSAGCRLIRPPAQTMRAARSLRRSGWRFAHAVPSPTATPTSSPRLRRTHRPAPRRPPSPEPDSTPRPSRTRLPIPQPQPRRQAMTSRRATLPTGSGRCCFCCSSCFWPR